LSHSTSRHDSRKAPEYRIVIADGSLVTINSVSSRPYFCSTFLPLISPHFPLVVFWAMRSGGAGSWGVIIDATFRTLPIFNATLHKVTIDRNIGPDSRRSDDDTRDAHQRLGRGQGWADLLLCLGRHQITAFPCLQFSKTRTVKLARHGCLLS
jgi:hypothetical protein